MGKKELVSGDETGEDENQDLVSEALTDSGANRESMGANSCYLWSFLLSISIGSLQYGISIG